MPKTIRIHLDINMQFEIDPNSKHYKHRDIEDIIESVTGGSMIDIEKAFEHRKEFSLNAMKYTAVVEGVVR